jgi:phosphatidylethanolamine-binding protein (PEBP) family uncharacterized protein
MRPLQRATAGVALLAVLLLAGCGGVSPAKVKAIPTIAFTSPVIGKGAIPALYTCDGRDISPSFQWGTVPAGVGSLALFVVGFTPQPSTKTYKVSVEWAVAGLNPALHKIPAGKLPRGAYLGTVSGGKRQRYAICPKKGTSVHYQFELYGVPASATVAPHFAGFSVLSSLAARNSPSRTDAFGGFAAIYKRK